VNERINAVSRTFWTLLALSLVLIAIGLPLGHDGDTLKVVDELSTFEHGFDRALLEKTLLAHASHQGFVGIDAVALNVRGRGMPKVTATPGAAPIAPRAALALATLSDVRALTAPSALVPIGSPKAEQLGAALGWRLSRQPGSAERYELKGIVLGTQGCAASDIDLEQQVVGAREHLLDVRAQTAQAQKQFDDADQLLVLRRKWKAPWKAILKATEKRTETQNALTAAQQQLAQGEKNYETLAKRAESYPSKGADKPSAGGLECAVATASLIEKPSGRAFDVKLPAPIERHAVPVPRLTGADFPAVQAAGLWAELKDMTAQQAVAHMNERFTWHYRHFDIGGLKVGGMTVLQFAPLLLLPLFFGLIRRSRGLGATYNPFDRVSTMDNLPTVGFGSQALNLVVLVALPLLACVLCAWSLMQISQPPLVPALCALATLGLGSSCHVALKDLLELRDAITRSHSNPPPAPNEQSTGLNP
jgi:hypothetical protein